MAIQLQKDPVIKINGEELEGFCPVGFTMTKRLLEPNRLDFILRKSDMTLTQEDIKFELRDKLLGALVECSVSAYRSDNENDWLVDDVDNFFKGYIQQIKVVRKDNKSDMRIYCTAFSPDARLKQYPGNSSRTASTLKQYVLDILMEASDVPHKFNPDAGEYDVIDFLDFEVNTKESEETPMPYTVQYHESDYDFLKRLAKRYGEYFYYEDGKIIFGKMKEYDPLTLRTGIDIEQYDYNLAMNHHTGAVLSNFDYVICSMVGTGVEKGPSHEYTNPFEPYHEMSKTAFERSTEYFNSSYNAISDFRSARIMDDGMGSPTGKKSEMVGRDKAEELEGWMIEQRKLLDRYVMADTLICKGMSRRVDLKLGSVIVIEDETNVEEGSSEIIQHEPLKVIDLVYVWEEEENRTMKNWFKAIPQKAEVPPYLERDENGFLTYGDFDIFPHCGPQSGRVIDVNDPLHMGRVRVALFWQNIMTTKHGADTLYDVKERCTPWIRVALPYGGWRRGCYLVPEIDDEVMVGFENNNAERPYVMASVHNWYVDEPVASWTENDSVANNEYKAIRTRNGHTIEIRDRGEHGYIKIYDENTHNYVVTYDTDKKLIRLQSKGNIELVADSNIVLKAGNNIIMEAGNNIESHAQNDISRTADHDIFDTEGNDYVNSVGNDYNAFITETGTHIHMIEERIQMELDGNEEIFKMQKNAGIGIVDKGPGTKAVVSSKNEVLIESNFKVNINSDLQLNAKSKEVNAEGEVDVNIKGGIVKIN